MTNPEILTAEPRSRVGKGTARKLRAAGRVPAVVYGEGQPPLTISLEYRDLQKRLYTRGFLTQLMDVDVDGSKTRVIPRDYQLDPVTDFPIHVDFLRVGDQTRVVVDIPVAFVNQEQSPGLKRGGVLNIVRHAIEVKCRAMDIPRSFTVDLTGRSIGDTIHVSHINMPPDVTPTITDRDFTIATVVAPTGLKKGGA